MRLSDDGNLGHLTYCTNIHAAEGWDEVRDGLGRHLPAIKEAVSPQAPLGVGLRVAAAAAQALRDPDSFAALRELLGTDYYVFTVNGFPYGAFHGQRVKEGAYRPDWSEPERLSYTDVLADQLAELLPDGMTGSVSTVPCTFKPWLEGTDRERRLAAIDEHVLRHVAHLVALRERTGKTIVLALEPEPFCMLETVEETVAWFESSMLSAPGLARLGKLTGLAVPAAEEALRRHLGVCYDVCHAAVEFENPAGSVAELRAAGIDIAKLQLSSALQVTSVDESTARALRPFDEPVYLHQTMERRGEGPITRYLDLDDALRALPAAEGAQWRSHFHVPVFLEEMEHFATTQHFLRDILELHARQPISDHLEVETYTWDVLPAQYRNVDLSTAIARELRWVCEVLGVSSPAISAMAQ